LQIEKIKKYKMKKNNKPETDLFNNSPSTQGDDQSNNHEMVSWKQLIFGAFIMMALPAIVLFGTSGQLNWWMAWIYIGVTTAFSMGSRIIMLRKYPDLIADRASISDKDDAKSWDKLLSLIVVVIGPIFMLLVAGLDMRFNLSPSLSLAFQITGLVITMLGYSLGMWAAAVNKYFSAVVRIQQERGHSTITSGPYRYLRHPGYAGGILVNLTMPLVLDSLWAFMPAVLVNCLLKVRTEMEDRTLRKELIGYSDYAERVCYRLIPGIW
jgi:protein-S-isoprenylcysteine O-methyltransferase Ste14